MADTKLKPGVEPISLEGQTLATVDGKTVPATLEHPARRQYPVDDKPERKRKLLKVLFGGWLAWEVFK